LTAGAVVERFGKVLTDGLAKAEVARTFGVSRSSVKRYVKMDVEFGSLAPSKPPGSTPKINGTAQRLLELDLKVRPAATLTQRSLKRLGYSHKRRSVAAAERDEFDRAAWQVLVADQIEADRFVFVDEMGSNTSLYWLCAWAQRGQRVRCSVPRNRSKNPTLLASITTTSMGPSLAIEGSMDALVFETYVEQFLVPNLRVGQVVVMDNLGAHKGERVSELLEEAGCGLLYLPTRRI
jgi:predicted transcriptional regulator